PHARVNVLVTGGAGFIGSHLCEALAARGDRVTAVDDLSTGVADNVPADVELVETDVADPGALARAFDGRSFDAVLHVAGQASIATSFANPGRDLRTNVVGTLNVIESCLAAGVPRLVYASSMTVYGEPDVVPTPEGALCRPVSYYGVTKYAAERYVHVAGARTDVSLSVTSLRMFNVYGERQSLSNPYQGVLAIFIGNVLRGEPITIHSDGRQTRDFVYVADAVDAWLRVLDAPETAGAVFNVGSGRETPISELATAVVRGFGESPETWEVRQGPAQEGDQRRAAADDAALERATGWRPATSLDDGMARTIAWARTERR
ncbi:MAG: NAD-dependent epimerase/dehydratase family protein, partial [Actinomycetota bacterium]|nr:NAD-dependent epimerase/dehydratase family protein [Actinomycetota bacterium]